MTNERKQGQDTQMICASLNADRMMIYATKESIEKIISSLKVLISSDARNANEVNIVGMFTDICDDGSLSTPPIVMGDGLGEILDAIRIGRLRRDIADGIAPADAHLAPFEISIMQVSEQAIREEMAARDHLNRK